MKRKEDIVSGFTLDKSNQPTVRMRFSWLNPSSEDNKAKPPKKPLNELEKQFLIDTIKHKCINYYHQKLFKLSPDQTIDEIKSDGLIFFTGLLNKYDLDVKKLKKNTYTRVPFLGLHDESTPEKKETNAKRKEILKNAFYSYFQTCINSYVLPEYAKQINKWKTSTETSATHLEQAIDTMEIENKDVSDFSHQTEAIATNIEAMALDLAEEAGLIKISKSNTELSTDIALKIKVLAKLSIYSDEVLTRLAQFKYNKKSLVKQGGNYDGSPELRKFLGRTQVEKLNGYMKIIDLTEKEVEIESGYMISKDDAFYSYIHETIKKKQKQEIDKSRAEIHDFAMAHLKLLNTKTYVFYAKYLDAIKSKHKDNEIASLKNQYADFDKHMSLIKKLESEIEYKIKYKMDMASFFD